MTFPPLTVLKLPLSLLLAVLLLAGGGIGWSHGRAHEAETALQQRRGALNSAHQQLDRSRQQQQLIATHLADYQALVERGFVGTEDRLAWIEAAQNANRDAGLYGLDYRLTPRTSSPPAIAQGLPLGQTTMTLNLPLLVETDLPRYIAALKARAPGLVRVHGCRMSRMVDAPFEALNQPRLQAECDLAWFTVATPPGNTP